MIQRSDFEDYYFDNVLASDKGVFLTARAYPEEGVFVYLINKRGDPQTYSFSYIDTAISIYNKLLKNDI